ncbi:MAG: hypothetical protein JO057_30045 [Chloroflexi bacterium]|nr:hypothetical protein [Chloroflexota bacterium]
MTKVMALDEAIGIPAPLELEEQSNPFTTPSEVQAATGWPLRVADDCSPTPPPTSDELRLIREADPLGFWTRDGSMSRR